MNTTVLQLLFIAAGNVASCCMTMYLIRWKKRENKPRELEIAIDDLHKELEEFKEHIPSDFVDRFRNLELMVNSFRERIARVETKQNGTAWKPGGIAGT